MKEGSGIAAHRNNGELRIELLGTFDETSARRLIECLQNHRKQLKKAVIETQHLSRLEPSGRRAFLRRLHELEDLCYYLVFYGKHAQEISPAWTFSF